ncbi:MAG: glycosyltransferase family 9 protein [Hyphomonadaceae bacterium]|nr:glycosyltransferase family 9 protein [Hyphomonadaceae bacterium]
MIPSRRQALENVAPPPAKVAKVLVIKLNAVGEFIQSLAAAKIVRDHHVGARITLLTTAPFKDFAEKCPYFDVVEADGRPREPAAITQLVARIRAAKYDVVYDFETSGRTNRYFLALRPWPPLWSGTAQGCSHPYGQEERAALHPIDRYAAQLQHAGLPAVDAFGEAQLPDLTWIRRALRDPPRLDPAYFGIKGPYVLMMPGGSPEHLERRWPEKSYAELAKRIAANGVTPVVIGAVDEKDVGLAVAAAEPKAKNLVSRTDFFQIAALSERATLVVGNVTGPMHIAAAAGAPLLVLAARTNDPDRNAPRGRRGAVLINADHLGDLPALEVDRAMKNLGAYRT